MNMPSDNSHETTEELSGSASGRRDFLKVISTVAVEAVLPFAAASGAIPAAAQSVERKVKESMQTRKLGGLEVSELGFGCMSISGTYGPPADRNPSIRRYL